MNTGALNPEPDLNPEQHTFVATAALRGAIAVVGPPGSGKTYALLHHVRQHAPAKHFALLTKGDPIPLAQTAKQLLAPLDEQNLPIATFLEFSHRLFTESASHCGLPNTVTVSTDSAAFERFRELARPLLDLEWPELLSGEIDPEVSGLRYPDRFLATTYRLFERLRSAAIHPEDLQELGLRGTTTFYATPPNFADAELLRATKEAYRDSLRVNFPALDHQRRREADLARIIGRLAHIQAEDSLKTATFSPQQALKQLTQSLEEQPNLAQQLRLQFPYIAIDEAQELSHLERRFLLALCGPDYPGVVLSGDIDLTPGTYKTKSTLTFGMATTTVILSQRYRGNAAIWNTQQLSLAAITGPQTPHPYQRNATPSVNILRTEDRQTEGEIVAAEFCARIARGIPPERCALILRSLNCAWRFVSPLLSAGIPIDFMGSIDPLIEPRTGDIHGILWALIDRTNAAAFLRVICSPLLALNDRTIALLCAQSGEPTLFALEPSSRERSSRNPERIAANLLDGLNDTALDASTRSRLEAFRQQWQGWQQALHASSSTSTICRIIRETGLLAGEAPAARLARSMTARFLSLLEEYQDKQACDHQLTYRLTAFDTSRKLGLGLQHRNPIDSRALVITSAEAVRGHAFDIVAIPDARAGAFPRYYVPDSFLFSPTRGFIPRENVGSAGASRTAKFTWYLHAAQARESYNREERKLFCSAIARAHCELLISASGPATRGLSAPEFLEEVRRAGIQGVETLSPNERAPR